MDWQLNSQKSTTSQLQLAVSLTDVEKAIFKLIQERETISIDEITLIAGEKQSKLAITLLELEMKGLIMTMPGKIYRSYKQST